MRENLALRKPMTFQIDYGFLQNILPKNILPSNIDGLIVLDSGECLYLEWKKPKEPISKGQARALINLARNPKNTVWLVRGESRPDKFYIMNIYEILPDGGSNLLGYGVNKFKQLTVNWTWNKMYG